MSEGFDIGYELAGNPWSRPGDRLPTSQADMYGENVWPDDDDVSDFRTRYLAYFRALLMLSRNLLQVFALALDLPEDFFDPIIKHPGCMSRLIHYSPQRGPGETQQGIAPHTVSQVVDRRLMMNNGNADTRGRRTLNVLLSFPRTTFGPCKFSTTAING
jgi:isopenicillin N synthase-like dioxygenase